MIYLYLLTSELFAFFENAYILKTSGEKDGDFSPFPLILNRSNEPLFFETSP